MVRPKLPKTQHLIFFWLDGAARAGRVEFELTNLKFQFEAHNQKMVLRSKWRTTS